MPERRTAAKLIRFHPEELARITERARAVSAPKLRAAPGAVVLTRRAGISVVLGVLLWWYGAILELADR